MDTTHVRIARGFTLLELVLVVVILGLVAAIALPRMSRGAAGAVDSSVASNLAVLRSALDLYQVEHTGVYPTTANVVNQLLQFSDINGNTSATRTTTCIYGPYVRSIPVLQVGVRKGQAGIAAADAATIGWIYNSATGNINANTTTEADVAGKAYNTY
jgi:prepilin-type N-terminal cleavage/methylation domain-containing protein